MEAYIVQYLPWRCVPHGSGYWLFSSHITTKEHLGFSKVKKILHDAKNNDGKLELNLCINIMSIIITTWRCLVVQYKTGKVFRQYLSTSPLCHHQRLNRSRLDLRLMSGKPTRMHACMQV